MPLTVVRLTICLPPPVAKKLRAIADEHYAGNASKTVAEAVTKYVPASPG